jgi:hypothetical protein
LFAGDGLNGGNGDDMNNVVDCTAARQIIRGTGQPLKYGSDGGGAGKPFH